jgi:hypothetical protein
MLAGLSTGQVRLGYEALRGARVETAAGEEATVDAIQRRHVERIALIVMVATLLGGAGFFAFDLQRREADLVSYVHVGGAWSQRGGGILIGALVSCLVWRMGREVFSAFTPAAFRPTPRSSLAASTALIPWSMRLRTVAIFLMLAPVLLWFLAMAAILVIFPDALPPGKYTWPHFARGLFTVTGVLVILISPLVFLASSAAASVERRHRYRRYRRSGLEVKQTRSPWLIGGVWAGCWTLAYWLGPVIAPVLRTNVNEFNATAHPVAAIYVVLSTVAFLVSGVVVGCLCWRNSRRRRREDQRLAAAARLRDAVDDRAAPAPAD